MGEMTAIAMQKGGVGKTTTAMNMSVGFALGGYRTLLVDLDPQANASNGLGYETSSQEAGVYEWIFETASEADSIHPTSTTGLDLIPSSPDLNGARAELPRQNSEYNELDNAFKNVRNKYDWILIDCPPSLGPLTLNALRTCDSILIPLQCEYYALEGLSQLWKTQKRIQNHWNHDLRCLGILMTMYDYRTNLSKEVEEEVRSYFEDRVLETVIPRNVRISESPGFGESVISNDPMSRGSKAYLRATEEVIRREQQRTG